MKIILATLITSFILLVFGQAFASTAIFPGQSIDSLNSALIYENDKDKKKKKKKEGDLPEEKEPECD